MLQSRLQWFPNLANSITSNLQWFLTPIGHTKPEPNLPSIPNSRFYEDWWNPIQHTVSRRIRRVTRRPTPPWSSSNLKSTVRYPRRSHACKRLGLRFRKPENWESTTIWFILFSTSLTKDATFKSISSSFMFLYLNKIFKKMFDKWGFHCRVQQNRKINKDIKFLKILTILVIFVTYFRTCAQNCIFTCHPHRCSNSSLENKCINGFKILDTCSVLLYNFSRKSTNSLHTINGY